MEGGQTGGGGGGPAPFLLKTYEMVDDSSTDEIVSWSSKNTSFVVWNPPEFSRLLLPAYFKHNNFSSFIRQLNTYGFRKIDPERWEFANEEFVKDQKHLLKNIHRRKPIHSHSQPQGSLGDAERAALDEEIEKLSREKNVLEANVWRFEQQNLGTKVQLEDLGQRVQDMEQRQLRMRSFLEKAVSNPSFVEYLVRMVESSMDISAYNKKRRLPVAEHFLDDAENSSGDNHSGSSGPGFGHVFHRDFTDKLKLELSPSVSDTNNNDKNNFVTLNTQSSNEDGRSPQRKITDGEPKDVQRRAGGSFAPETLDLSDTGTSFALKMDTSLSRQARENENNSVHCFQRNLTSTEEGDGHISCQLNLTLASSPLQVNKSNYSTPGLEIVTSAELKSNFSAKESDVRDVQKDRNVADGDATVSSSQGAPSNSNQGPATAQGQVNDVFWEQFLTERPGSSDAEEASSSLRANISDQEGRKRGQENSWRSIKNMGQLTL